MNQSRLSRTAVLSLSFVCSAGGCTSYQPQPVDLQAHRRAFQDRLGSGRVEAFAKQLRDGGVVEPAFDLDDGISLHEAELLTLLFHPGLRTARLQSGVADASAETAGYWQDPVLGGNFERILDNVANPWFAFGTLQLTLPLLGQRALERDEGNAIARRERTRVRAQEADALRDLTATWLLWSRERTHTDLLEQLLVQLDDLVAIAQRLLAADAVTRLDARIFELEQLQRTIELEQVRARLLDREMDLRMLMGLHPTAPVALLPQTHVAQTELQPDPSGQQDPTQRLAEGPQLLGLQHAHDASEQSVKLEIRRQWPELTLLPGFGEEQAQQRAMLSFSLPIPLLNGNAQGIAVARANRQLAAEQLRTGFERTLQEFARRRGLRDNASRRRLLVEDQLVPLAERQLADGRRALELGNLDTLLLLDAMLRAHNARVQALQAAIDEALATNETNRLFWPDRYVLASEETTR